jgi:hypothetical protein
MSSTSTPVCGWVPVIRHIVIAAALLGSAFAVFQGAISFSTAVFSSTLDDLVPPERKAICRHSGKTSERKAAEEPLAMTKSSPSDSSKLAKPLLPNLANYPASDAERERIAIQALKAQRLECLHVTLLEMYVRNYYGSVVVTMIFGGIAAIALFFVGPKGWLSSDQYLVNVLIVSAAIAAFYGAFPGVFRQPDLITAHNAQALRYETLLDGMASHTAMPNLVPSVCPSPCTRAQGRVCDQPFPTADFIACIDAALAITDIPFGLDPKSHPDYQKALAPAAGK